MIRFVIAMCVLLVGSSMATATDGPVRNFFRNVDARQDARFARARVQALQVQPLCVQKFQAVKVQQQFVQPVILQQQSYHVQPIQFQAVQAVQQVQYQAVQPVVVQKVQASGCAAFFSY